MLRRTAALVTSGALALGGVALLVPRPASATQTADQVAAQADPGQQGQQGRARLLTPELRQQLRQTGHITLTRHTRRFGNVTVLVQRGVVTAVSPTSISLRSKDGYEHTYVVTSRTKVRERRQPVPLSDLTVGERAMVVALQTAQGDVARRISCLRPAASGAATSGAAAG